QEGTTLVSQFGQTLTYDKRDNRIDPRDGYIAQFTTEIAGAGGDEKFLRLKAKAAYYLPFDNVWGLAFLGQGGYVLGLGQDVSIAERFFIGGHTFRGFEKAGIGPRDVETDDALGGNQYYVGSVEMTCPTGLPEDLGMRAFIFTDVGSVWNLDEDGPEVRDASSIRASLGIGTEFVTAFGRIRVDLAEPIIKEDFD